MTDETRKSGEATRRDTLLGLSAIGAALAAGTAALPARAQMAQGHREVRPGTPPLQGIRVIERSATLSGRLAGLLLADQRAEVFVERRASPSPGGLDDTFFDRGKIALPPAAIADTSSADIVIVDGEAPATRAPHQVLVRIVAALPGDEAYGDLPHDCSEDLINAIGGFFTNMSVSGPILNRPVIYTPIPLPSVYCGVNAAVATVATLVDRQRTGLGREIVASRIAGGLSAIGALSITSEGLPKHLEPIVVGGLPPGMTPEQFHTFVADALRDPERQLWLERRFAPFSTPYRASDGRWILPMAAPNRRLSRRFLEAMGIWDRALATGAVFEDPYDPASEPDARRNLGDSLSLGFTYTSALADMLEPAFATRTAAEWERFLAANGVAASIIMSWEEWRGDADARAAGVFAEVPGDEDVQIGRAVWTRSAQPYAPLAGRREAAALPPREAPPPAVTGRSNSRLPLEGYTVVDMTNVLAGPCCTRMFVELGASVTRLDVMDPQHAPTIHVMWSGENSAGKRSIILDRRTPDGLALIHRLAGRADIVCANLMDDQMARLGIDAATLRQQNPRGIGLQITATRGETSRAAAPRQRLRPFHPGHDRRDDAIRRSGGADLPRDRLRGGLSLRLPRHLCRCSGPVRTRTARRQSRRLGGNLALQRGDPDPAAIPAAR